MLNSSDFEHYINELERIESYLIDFFLNETDLS